MASIFLSYARADAAKAARVATALEAAGHSVWWDEQIGAGSRFSKEIDLALREAELVVVLWSKASIESAWVQDEAAAGRDTGRLVPVLIERVEPPLGFRQYQSVTLSSRGAPAALIEAVGARLGERPKPASRLRRFDWRMVTAVAASIVLMAAGAWWLLVGAVRSGGETLAIAAVDPRAGELARSLARDLGRYQSGPLGRLILLDAGDAGFDGAAYRLEVASGPQLSADLALKQAKGGLLWSGLVEGASTPADLRRQVAGQIGDVLICLAESGEWRAKLELPELALFLKGCAGFSSGEAVNAYRQLTRKDPDFGPGWAGLSAALATRLPVLGSADRERAIPEAGAALDRAKALAPDWPETIVADGIMRRGGGAKLQWQVDHFAKAITARPDNPLLHAMRSDALLGLGRMEEAVDDGEQAIALNPLSPAIFSTYVGALAYSGQVDAAFAQISAAEASWPGSDELANLRYRMNLRFGDPRAAKNYLRNAANMPAGSRGGPWEAFLNARAFPTTRNIETALALFRERFAADPGDIPGYLQALVTFGRVDEAFDALKNPVALDSLSGGTDALFRPYMKSMRDDPRFMMVAKQLGLVDVWQKSGMWPDFCRQPSLPYDCKVEGSKLAGMRVITP